jgi:hypothetical protein
MAFVNEAGEVAQSLSIIVCTRKLRRYSALHRGAKELEIMAQRSKAVSKSGLIVGLSAAS